MCLFFFYYISKCTRMYIRNDSRRVFSRNWRPPTRVERKDYGLAIASFAPTVVKIDFYGRYFRAALRPFGASLSTFLSEKTPTSSPYRRKGHRDGCNGARSIPKRERGLLP